MGDKPSKPAAAGSETLKGTGLFGSPQKQVCINWKSLQSVYFVQGDVVTIGLRGEREKIMHPDLDRLYSIPKVKFCLRSQWLPCSCVHWISHGR